MRSHSHFIAVFLITISVSIQEINAENATVNQNISFSLKSPKDTIEIVCKFGDDKILDWSDLTKEPEYYRLYKGRTMINKTTLSISGLRKVDSGTYTLVYTLQDGNTERESFNLMVFDPLPKPKITCSSNVSVARFTCNINSTLNDIRLEWTHDNVPQENDPSSEHLLVVYDPFNNQGSYICILNQGGNSEDSDPFQMTDCDGFAYRRLHAFLILPVLTVSLVVVGTIYWLR